MTCACPWSKAEPPLTAYPMYQAKAGRADVAPGRPALQTRFCTTCSCCACSVCTYAASTVQPSWGPFGAAEGSEGNDGVGAFPSLELSDNSWEAFDGDEEGEFLLGSAGADLLCAFVKHCA